MEENTAYNVGYGVGQLLMLAVFLIPALLFLLTQRNTLRLIRPENRLLHPALVWLQAIPLFGMAWQFVVITRIAGSIRKEMQAGAEDSILGFDSSAAVEVSGKSPTLLPGLLYCSGSCLLVIVIIITNLLSGAGYMYLFTSILVLLAILTLICWVIYWIVLAKYQRKLKEAQLVI